MLFKEMVKIELTSGHIGIMLIMVIAKIQILLCIKNCQIEINRQPYLNYAKYRDGQKRINRRPYCNSAKYGDSQNRIIRRQYCYYANNRGSQKRIYRRPHWIYANYRDGRIELIGRHIGIMLIIEIA